MSETPSAIKSGMDRAHSMREKWFKTLVSGEVDFDTIVQMSKTAEYKPLEKLKLLDILKSRPGWSDVSARDAMIHFGFGPEQNIVNIRRSQKSVDTFAYLLDTSSDKWRPKPTLPEKWPFNGKLIQVIREQEDVDIEIPGELLEFEAARSDEHKDGDAVQNDEDIDDLLDDIIGGDD